MLRSDSIQASYSIAAGLASRGVVLTPAENTPVSVLVNAVKPQADLLLANRGKTVGGLESYDQLLAAASSTPLPDNSVIHDDRKAELVEMARAAITSNLSIARNIVTPKIRQVVEEVNSYVDSQQQATLNLMSIEPLFYSPIWDTEIPESLCGRHTNQFQTDLPLKPLGLPVPSDWAPLLTTGIPSYDGELAKWASGLDGAFLTELWEEVFGLRTSQTLFATLSSKIGSDVGTYGRLDAPLVVFLAARHLIENLPASVNLDLSAYRVYMSELVARAGQAVINTVQRRQTDLRNGLIIVSVPRTGSGAVYVLGDNYNAFLENGGSAEAVLGAAYTRQTAGVVVQPNPDEVKRLEESWAAAHALLKQQALANRRTSIINGLRQAVTRLIVDTPDEELAPNVPREVFTRLLNERLAALTIIRQEDLWILSRGLVCQVLYAHTEVERILCHIDDAGADNPGLAPREAALLATIAYVAEWVVEQVDVSNVRIS